MSVYHRHPKRGGGRSVVYITAADGTSLRLESLDEQLLAAQIIQAQLILGASREDAEATAAKEVLARRRAKKWFGWKKKG